MFTKERIDDVEGRMESLVTLSNGFLECQIVNLKPRDIGSGNGSQKFSSLFSSELLSILFLYEHSKSSWRLGTPVIGYRTRNVRGVSRRPVPEPYHAPWRMVSLQHL